MSTLLTLNIFHMTSFGVFPVNSKQIAHNALVFLMLTLNKYMPTTFDEEDLLIDSFKTNIF